jgi:hypothetical protein
LSPRKTRSIPSSPLATKSSLSVARYAVPWGFLNPGTLRDHRPAWRSTVPSEPFSNPETKDTLNYIFKSEQLHQ